MRQILSLKKDVCISKFEAIILFEPAPDEGIYGRSNKSLSVVH